MLRPPLPVPSAPCARAQHVLGAAGPPCPIRTSAAAASLRRPDPPWPAVPAIVPLHAERSAAFRPPPRWGSADDPDRYMAFQSNKSGRPPSRMPSVPSPLSRVNRTGKLGARVILSSRCNGQKLVICPQQTSENRALERNWQTDVAVGYRKRLDKYRDRLFTFLDYDGVPWNNNN